PPLQDQHRSESACDAREADSRFVGPAVPPGQLGRLPAPFHRQGKRPDKLKRRLAGQGGELQIGPPDPARQRDTLPQVPPPLLPPGDPDRGAAQGDRRPRAGAPARAGPNRARRVGDGLHRGGALARPAPAAGAQPNIDASYLLYAAAATPTPDLAGPVR